MIPSDLGKMVEELEARYNELVPISANWRIRRWFRLRTLSNLIYHLKDVPENDRDWIFQRLSLYMDEFLELKDSMTSNESIRLYRDYLDSVTDYYDRILRFAYFSYDVIVFLYLVIALGLYWVSNLFFFVSTSVLLAAVVITYYRKKWLRRKLYGYFY